MKPWIPKKQWMNQNLPQRQNSPQDVRNINTKGRSINTYPGNCTVCGKLVQTSQGYVLPNGLVHATADQCKYYEPYYKAGPIDEKNRQKALDALDRFIVVCSNPRLLAEMKHYEDWLLKVDPVMISEAMTGANDASWLYALPKIQWKGVSGGDRFVGLLEKVAQGATSEYDPKELEAWLNQKTDEIPTELQPE